LVFYKLSGLWSFSDPNWPLGKDEKVKIKNGTQIVQKFTADRNGLARIEVLFGSSNLDQGATLTMKIYDETCSGLIRESSFFSPSIGSDNTEDFVFSKIPDSKNKTFCLNLSFSPVINSKSTTVFAVSNSMSQNKSLMIDGQNFSGQSLSMRPAYKNNNLWGDLTELNQRISQYKPWFLKHYYLAAVALSFIILSFILVAILILS
jgi:hypothetical protein